MANEKLFWMPWYYPDFLADTTELDALLTGAYMLLIGREFFHGPLPNDPVLLCRIAKLEQFAPSIGQAGQFQAKEGHAPSIAQAWPEHALKILLSNYFTQLPDGRWSQKRVEVERAKAIHNRAVNSERARKAANVRWNKERMARKDKENKNDAPSIAQAMLEECSPQGVLSTRGYEPLRVSPPLPKTGAVAPRGGSPDPPSPAGKSSPGNPTGPKQSKTKAKPPKTGPGRAANGGNDESGTAGAKRRVAAKVNSGAGHLKNGFNRQNADFPADGRFEPFREEIFRYWAQQNLGDKKAGECPWMKKDQTALSGLLRASPEMSLETFQILLVHRAQSQVLASDPPRNWLTVDLKRFSAGPLDRFKQPLKAPRTM
jgi:uncharacterized protein YdaU (DUF1376 family)